MNYRQCCTTPTCISACIHIHTYICVGVYIYFIDTLPYMYKVKSGLSLDPWRIREIQEKDMTHQPE